MGDLSYRYDGTQDRVSFRFDLLPLIRQCLAHIQNSPPDPSDRRLEGVGRFPLPISETNAEWMIGGGFSARGFSEERTAL